MPYLLPLPSTSSDATPKIGHHGKCFIFCHPYRHDVSTACRFEQSQGIGGIGLVAFDVGADISGGQQLHLDPQAIQPARLVMGGTAGFHHYEGYLALVEPAFELAAAQAIGFNNRP